MIGLSGVKKVAGGADDGTFLSRGFAEREAAGGLGSETLRPGDDEEGVEILFRLMAERAKGGIVARLPSPESDGLPGVDPEAGRLLVTEEALAAVVRIGIRAESGVGAQDEQKRRSDYCRGETEQVLHPFPSFCMHSSDAPLYRGEAVSTA